MVKSPPAMWETWVWSLGCEDPLEEEMATHSSILVWRIPWTEESGGLQSMGSWRARHNWATKHSTILNTCKRDQIIPMIPFNVFFSPTTHLSQRIEGKISRLSYQALDRNFGNWLKFPGNPPLAANWHQCALAPTNDALLIKGKNVWNESGTQ